jgi:hypothetical protein
MSDYSEEKVPLSDDDFVEEFFASAGINVRDLIDQTDYLDPDKDGEPLSLAEAAELYGVSLSTLRRRVRDRELRVFRKKSSRSQVMTSHNALEAAGFSRPFSARLPVFSSEEIDRLTNQVALLTTQLEAERDLRRAAEGRVEAALVEAAEQRGRAEVALELRPMLEQAIDRLTDLRAEALSSSRPVLEVSSEQRSSQRRGLIDRLRGR